jgi:tetratricopeptide (TPR) repeat protein
VTVLKLESDADRITSFVFPGRYSSIFIYVQICYNRAMENNDGAKKSDNIRTSAGSRQTRDVKPADFLRAVKANLRNGKQKEAFVLLQQAAVRFPDEPLILSYYGCFQALVDKKYRSGVETCKQALVLLKQKESFEEELLYPVFFLNLGRAYLSAGKKPDAIESFRKGLKYDNSNGELLKELRGLGIRKAPPVPFLDRSNPINKYIGMILRPEAKNHRKQSRQHTLR